MTKATIDEADVRGKRVLLRVDFNVPMRDGEIVDDRRIRSAVPTIEALRSRGARTIAVTHLGRPKGRVDDSLRVTPLARRLGELLGVEVRVAPDVAGPGAREVVASLHDGDVGMLENVRFEPGEEANDPGLTQQLAALADVYVNDAFGAAHRAHASTEGVAHLLPAYAGYLMARELDALGGVLEDPRRPVVAIVGGAKISTKLAVLQNLVDRVDVLWIGGAMACTFYQALGLATGRSLVEPDQVETARRLQESTRTRRAALKLPVDVVVSAAPDGSAPHHEVRAEAIPDGEMVVDVGSSTTDAIAADCRDAGTVVWNGPLGIYEVPAFAAGTRAVAMAVADSPAYTVIGGGDLAAALHDTGVEDKIDHISTGGGATIEFLEGRTLPGVAALREREAARS
ncbi:MAG: phosphoglycerate kinase [Candidatus Dormibacteraeota bacterium]|nr:phosphoglycerate kinase [Candidatus Dormibacteraeota bacterium]MBV9525257.1 phosphoglycerate kinase [Candidatus Dormibacteraeota bacterium]